MKVSEYFKETKQVEVGLGTKVLNDGEEYVIAFVGIDDLNHNVIKPVATTPHGCYFNTGCDSRSVGNGERGLTEAEAREMFGCCYEDITVVTDPPMKLSDCFAPRYKPWLGVGTILELHGRKYVVAKTDYDTVSLVNVHGHSCYIGPHTITSHELSISQRELSKDEAKRLLTNCYDDATIVGLIS